MAKGLIPPDIKNTADIQKVNNLILDGCQKDEYDSQKIDIKGLKFTSDMSINRNINKIRFDNCKFDRFNFRHCNFYHTTFRNCKLIDPDFANSTLRGVSFYETAIVDHSNFRGSSIRYSEFHLCEMENADFRQNNINDSAFYLANLNGCNFSNSEIKNVDFIFTDLTNGKFIDVRFLEKIKIEDSIMKYTDLTGSKGLPDPIKYLEDNFEYDIQFYPHGLYVYLPITKDHDKYQESMILEETVNFDRTLINASGLKVYNKTGIFNILEQRKKSYHLDKLEIWKCKIFITWIPGIAVPYCPNNFIRTSKLYLMYKVFDSFFYN